MGTTLHYTTLHYTTLHYTHHYTTLHYTKHYTTLHYTLHYTTLHYTTLHTHTHTHTHPQSHTHNHTCMHGWGCALIKQLSCSSSSSPVVYDRGQRGVQYKQYNIQCVQTDRQGPAGHVGTPGGPLGDPWG